MSRGGGKIPQSLCRDLQHHVTHEGSRESPLAKPERSGRSLALLPGEKNSLGLSDLKKKLVVPSSESLMFIKLSRKKLYPVEWSERK